MKRRYSATLATFILVTAFTCLIAMPVMAGNQPPEGFQPMGPAIIAEITFTESESGIIFFGSGTCQGKPVTFPEAETPGALSDITPESILDNYIAFPTGVPFGPDGSPADCIPGDARGLIARAVTDFQDEGNYIFARIVLLFAVPK